jgi:rare lipoprotein A
MATATASWYNDAESTACGTHYALGVANKELPCGTRVEFCASRCAVGTVEDRGPFAAGRMWDLNAGLKEAIGASDLGPVRYRVL